MNNAERKHLDNSILKPYLIHVEFEVLNIESQINRDSVIKKAIMEKHLSIHDIDYRIKDFLITIEQLRSIFRHNI